MSLHVGTLNTINANSDIDIIGTAFLESTIQTGDIGYFAAFCEDNYSALNEEGIGENHAILAMLAQLRKDLLKVKTPSNEAIRKELNVILKRVNKDLNTKEYSMNDVKKEVEGIYKKHGKSYVDPQRAKAGRNGGTGDNGDAWKAVNETPEESLKVVIERAMKKIKEGAPRKFIVDKIAWLHGKLKEFNDKVKADPKNAPLWKRLISYVTQVLQTLTVKLHNFVASDKLEHIQEDKKLTKAQKAAVYGINGILSGYGGRALGGLAGGALGGYLGGPAGVIRGTKIGERLGAATGAVSGIKNVKFTLDDIENEKAEKKDKKLALRNQKRRTLADWGSTIGSAVGGVGGMLTGNPLGSIAGSAGGGYLGYKAGKWLGKKMYKENGQMIGKPIW